MSATSYLGAAAPELSAENPIEYNGEEQRLTARGSATFTHDQFVIHADTIEFYKEKRKAIASGHVQVTQKGIRLICKDLEYQADNKSFSANQFRLGNNNIIAEGSHIEGTPENITLSDTRLFLYEPDSVSPNISSQTIHYQKDDSITLEHLRFRIGNAYILALPRWEQSLSGARMRFRSEAGFRGNTGAYLQTLSFFPASNNTSIGGYIDLYSKRGILLGPVVDVKSDQLASELKTAYIRDTGSTGVDVLGESIDPDRYNISFQHQQQLGVLSITSRLSYQSDSEFFRDFKKDTFSVADQAYSFIELYLQSGHHHFSLFFRKDLNKDYVVSERLPQFRWEITPLEIGGTGVLQTFQFEFARLSPALVGSESQFALDSYTPSEAIDGRTLSTRISAANINRVDSYYGLSRPTRLSKAFVWTPLSGARFTHYSTQLDTSGNVDRLMGEFGFDLTGVYHADFNTQNEFFDVEGIRHLIRPVLHYRWQPMRHDVGAEIPSIDGESFQPILPVIDLSDARNTDTLREWHGMRLGIENAFITRSGKPNSRTFLNVNFYQDCAFTNPNVGSLDATYVTWALNISPWFSIEQENRFNTADMDWEARQTRFQLRSGNKWNASLYWSYIEDNIDETGLAAFYRFDETWSSKYLWRFDAIQDALIEQRYTLVQNLGRSWEIEYRLSFLTNDVREDSFSFSVGLHLIRF
jgi:LPS-assembly protein